MLIQALVNYAATYLQDQLADLAFEEKPVPYAIEIYEDGAFAAVRSRTEEVKRGKKTVSVPRSLLVPKSPVNRNTGLYPLLGCDGIQYVLGPGPWTEDGREDNHRERHEAFADHIRAAAQDTGDAALKACAAFYAAPDQVRAAREAMAQQNSASAVLVALAVVSRDVASALNGPIVARKAVRDYWRKHYERAFGERVANGGEGMCLVTGKTGPVAPTHDKVKGAASLGGQASGVALMSFDKAAFRSYGWEKNANSPVCPEAAAAYILALNDLMTPGEHRQGRSMDKRLRTRFDSGGVGFLYWTREPSDEDVVNLIENADPVEIRALLTAPDTGHANVQVNENEFYLMAVSGNGGRLLIRHWIRESLSKVQANVQRWFQDLRMADVFKQGEIADPPKRWQLLGTLSPPRTKSDDPQNGGRNVILMRRALQGLPLGYEILAAALNRLRYEQGSARLNPARIGLVRMCINDIARVQKDQGGIVMESQLQEEAASPGYLCGRLMAMYERLQYAAQGEVNVTVTDRYYALASTHPLLAFKKLEDLSKSHLKKLRRENPGARYNMEQDLHSLIERLNEFPPSLSLKEQGQFVIGYHHQKAHDTRAAVDAKGRKQNETATEN